MMNQNNNPNEFAIDGLSEDEIFKIYADIIESPTLISSVCCCGNKTGVCGPQSGMKCMAGYSPGPCSSDIRLKNILNDNNQGLNEIIQLNIKNYIYKNDKEKIVHVGVIAQDLQKIFPNAVKTDKNGYLTIRTEDMFYSMINAIKELNIQNQNLFKRLEAIEKINKEEK